MPNALDELGATFTAIRDDVWRNGRKIPPAVADRASPLGIFGEVVACRDQTLRHSVRSVGIDVAKMARSAFTLGNISAYF